MRIKEPTTKKSKSTVSTCQDGKRRVNKDMATQLILYRQRKRKAKTNLKLNNYNTKNKDNNNYEIITKLN